MTATEPTRGKSTLVAVLLALALVVAGADQVTKYLAEDRLTQGEIVPLVGDFLGLQLIYNPGAAFSLATGMTWIFTVVACVVVVVVLRVARRLRSRGWAVALGLLLGGSVGNLYDRLFREPGFARGHVVDFINYNGWFVGNVADIAIVLAAILIAVLALRGIEVDGTRIAAERARPEEDLGPASEDDALVSEEPLEDDEDFSPQVPRATGDDVDIARWAAGAAPASQSQRIPAGLATTPSADDGAEAPSDTDAVPADEDAASSGTAAASADEDAALSGTEPAPADVDTARSDADAAPAASAPASPGPTPGERAAPSRRWRSRREMRAATEGRDDG